MTVPPVLRLDFATREQVLRQHHAFINGVKEKLFPSFSDLEEEAEATARQEYSFITNSDPGNYRHDVSEIGKMAWEAGFTRYSDLSFVKFQLCLLAVAGIYHLWERLLKGFLIREITNLKLNEEKKRKIQNYNFKELIKFMPELGFSVEKQPFFDRLAMARLVANTCKHGDGQSLQELAKKEPSFFSNRKIFEGSNSLFLPDPDDLWIDDVAFEKLASAFTEFWEAMPEYLSVPHAWQKD